MDGIVKWIGDNIELLFAGSGAMVIAAIIRVIFKRRNNTPSQKIRSGNNSTNIQAGRDVVLEKKTSRDGVEEQ